MYANWLLSKCNYPIDEIEYLFDNLPKDHKKQISLDMQEHYNNQN